jgi:hypothetical protein
VTSRAAVLPLVAARMELILIAGVLVVVPFISELTAETELMTLTWLSRGRVIAHAGPGSAPSLGNLKLLQN